MAKAKRPDLAAAQAQVRAAESNIRVQQALGQAESFPCSALRAPRMPTGGGLDPRSGAIGVQLNIPLFTGYRNTYQILQAREQLECSRSPLATSSPPT